MVLFRITLCLVVLLVIDGALVFYKTKNLVSRKRYQSLLSFGTETWKLFDDSVLIKSYGLPLENGKSYSIFAFDLDHTITASKSGRILTRDKTDWEYVYPSAPSIIRNSLNSDSMFVIFSNQSNLKVIESRRPAFEEKIDSIISDLGITSMVPVVCMFATARDINRKPRTGMWSILKDRILSRSNCSINKKESFFVGDAAGRIEGWNEGKHSDWSSIDRKFALNLGLQFYTPEEYFGGETATEFFHVGPDPKTIKTRTLDPDSFLRKDSLNEMIITVGVSGSGKSTLYKRVFKSRGYVHINREIISDPVKLYGGLVNSLSSGGSVFVDDFNLTKSERLDFIKIAQELQIPVRCLHFTTEDWLCDHLNIFKYISNALEDVPKSNTIALKFEVPDVTEGFESVVQVPFTAEFDSNHHKNIFTQYLS